MAVERGIQKFVWAVRLEGTLADVDNRYEFEGRVMKLMAVPDWKGRVEFVWEEPPPYSF